MLIKKIKQLLSSQFIRNVGWLGTAELVNRIFRLGTTVTLARMFSSQDYGAMALIYTIFEFANVFTLRGGIGAKIIQANEQDLKIICNTSFWLNLILGISVFFMSVYRGISHCSILWQSTTSLAYLYFSHCISDIPYLHG